MDTKKKLCNAHAPSAETYSHFVVDLVCLKEDDGRTETDNANRSIRASIEENNDLILE